MKGLLSRLAIWAPGPIAALLNKWFELFARFTILSNPDWQRRGDASALALSVPVTVVIYAVCKNEAKARLSRRIKLSFGAFFLFVILCAVFYFYMLPPRPSAYYDQTQFAWMVCYILMLMSLVAEITFATLIVSKKS